MNSDAQPHRRTRRWLAPALAVALAAATFALFAPTLGYDLVDLDDNAYVSQNAVVLGGLNWPAVRLVFTQTYAAMYAPLLWVSYMLDVECFGQTAWGFHFVNVLLHALNASLFFLLLFAWTRKPWRAFFFAALWAWHPLRVESVAWIAERKDVLSGLFFLLCLAAYGAARRPAAADAAAAAPCARAFRAEAYWSAVLFLGLGLLVKPSLVPVPALLLLLDFWPLRRVAPDAKSLVRAAPRLLAEKIPFFLLAGAAAALSAQAHEASGALAETPLGLRLKALPIHCGFYLFKIFRPRNLTPLYQEVLFSRADFAIGLFLLAGITLWTWWSLRRRPNEFVGWLWFLGLLVPVVGLVRFGVQSVADRFTYLPAMGLSAALLFVWPTCRRPAAARPLAALRALAAAALLAALAFLSCRYLPAWRNSSALYDNVLRYFPDNLMALCQKAELCIVERGDFDEAERLISQAAEIDPQSVAVAQIQALCLSQRENPEAAYQQLLRRRNGNSLSNPGEEDWNLAVFAFAAKRYEETIAHAQTALRLMPTFNSTRNALVLLAMAAAFEKGDGAGALAHARQFPPYRAKTEIVPPDLLPAYVALWICSERHEAIAGFRRILAACPDRVDLLNNLAWALATADWSPAAPEEVLAFARRAQELQPAPHPGILDTLAAAQANAGDFAGAIQSAQAALLVLALPPETPEKAELAQAIAARLAEYRAGRPHRENAFLRLWNSMLI